MKISPFCSRKLIFMGVLAVCTAPFAAHAVPADTPSLIITSDPLPENLRQQIYSKPVQIREISPNQVKAVDNFSPMQTLVGQKIGEIIGYHGGLQNKVGALSAQLSAMERANAERAAEYYANIATINTQLQAGTTPGNPRLVGRLGEAEGQLNLMGDSVAQLNGMAVEVSKTASEASFLLEETRAAYSLSGAVEEDHVRLAEVEDSINGTVILIQRMLNNISDDITRTSSYLSAERENLQILALAVTNGDFYGRSLSSRSFSGAPRYEQASLSMTASADPYAPMASPAPAVQQAPMGSAGLSGPRPLAKIKFDRPDVAYEEPVYLAVNEALKRYPDARFDLIAVTPSGGNAAQVAIESTKARRNAENVLRTLTQMGLPQERIDLSYSESAQAATNEVHVFVK